MSPLKFSVEVGPKQSVPDYGTLNSICLECERLRYNALYIPDGVQWTGFECWTALSHISASTETLRLGPAATFVTYRHPVLLAKMAATLDVLSGGRVEFRLGAGGSGARIDEEYCGIPLPEADARIGMLQEGLQIIRDLWRGEQVFFKGKYFDVKGAVCNPRPVQKPHPPITVCADGGRMLRVAAGYSKIWEASQSFDDYKRKVRIFEEYCKGFERNPGSVERAFEITVAIGKSDREAEEMVEKYRRERVETGGYGFDPLENAVVGSRERCVEEIMKYRKAGITSFTIIFIGLKELEPLRLFAEHVIPAVASASAP